MNVYYDISEQKKEEYEPYPFHPELPQFVRKMIRDIGGIDPSEAKVLDIGCGFGRLVQHLNESNVDTCGCDVESFWKGERPELREIEWEPYRIPFDDSSFDVVITNTILEHVQNHAELYSEIKRILKPGGCAIHTMPGKWYLRAGKWFLPVEPHIRVPFVHMIWPNPQRQHVPRWWLALWAFLGVRSPYQKNKTWQETTDNNVDFCNNDICYLSHKEHQKLSMEVFGNYEYPMHYFLSNAYGGAAKLYQKSPFKKLTAWFFKHTRIALFVQRKEL